MCLPGRTVVIRDAFSHKCQNPRSLVNIQKTSTPSNIKIEYSRVAIIPKMISSSSSLRKTTAKSIKKQRRTHPHLHHFQEIHRTSSLHQPILIFQTPKTIFTNPSAPPANGRPSPLRNPSTPPAVPPGCLAPPSLESSAVARPRSARSSWPRPAEPLQTSESKRRCCGGIVVTRGSEGGHKKSQHINGG